MLIFDKQFGAYESYTIGLRNWFLKLREKTLPNETFPALMRNNLTLIDTSICSRISPSFAQPLGIH